MKGDGLAIELPPNPAPYLYDWLMEIGPFGAGGGTVLGWDSITNWQQITGVELNPWEARTLRQMSRDVVDQMAKARSPTCPAPYFAKPDNDEAVTDQFRRMFAAMKKNGDKPKNVRRVGK